MLASALKTGLSRSLFFVFVIYSSLSAADGVLAGRVINDSDSEPLFRVNIAARAVKVDSEPAATLSDENGQYEFRNLKPGLYDVTFLSVRFKTKWFVNIPVSANEATLLDVRLIPEGVLASDILVSASRRPEKILDAPASVSVVESDAIENRIALTPIDHIAAQPSVDMAAAGLNQANIVIRGFNNVFSGALLVLTDNRIARVPSLRYNAYSFIPMTDDDIERIELVSGPGSALYGPNSATGIMHIITKSPLSSKHTTASVGAGERNLYLGAFRHCNNFSGNFGYKISGQYYRGDEWESTDPYEPDSVRLFEPTAEGPLYVSEWMDNDRNFDIEKLSFDSRADIVMGDNTLMIVNGGINRSTGIELTSLGAAQVDSWRYLYAQTRFTYKNLFLQAFVNASDAGETYLLRTGQMIIDESKVYSAQIQHKYSPRDKLALIYGIDAIMTRPNTGWTVNGRNEDDDNIDEFGAYLQAETKLSDQVKLVGAGRADRHNRLEGTILSPRAAVVYQPDSHQNFRLTYNRAYSTPNSTNLFLDILQADDPFGVGSGFEQFVGFAPDIDVRVQGVPESGFHWRFGIDGPRFRSPFAPLDPRGFAPADFIDYNDPIFTDVMWNAGRQAVISGFESIMVGFGIPQETVDSLGASMRAITPTGLDGVNNALGLYNPDNGGFDPVNPSDISDIQPLSPTYTKTIELGYKGVLSERIQLNLDLYRTEKKDFVGPLAIETPNVFLDQESLSEYLFSRFTEILADPANSEHAAVLAGLDDPSLGGNGNGTAIDELTNLFAQGTSRIPFGTVSPDEAFDPNAVLVTFRNFGDIALYGIDLSAVLRLSEHLSVGGSYSFISKNLFMKKPGQLNDIYLNAPKHKFALHFGYSSDNAGLDFQCRLRFIDSFEMYGPFIGSRVDSYAILDLNAGIDFIYSTRLSLTIRNFLDNEHSEFVGAPRIGRLAMLRLSRRL